MLAVSESEFDAKVVRSAVPVVIDFWAPWCGPCRTMTALLGELEKEPAFASALLFVKVDIQDHPNLATRFAVKNIPTLVVMRHGAEIARQVGLDSKVMLRRLLVNALV